MHICAHTLAKNPTNVTCATKRFPYPVHYVFIKERILEKSRMFVKSVAKRLVGNMGYKNIWRIILAPKVVSIRVRKNFKEISKFAGFFCKI